MSSRVFVRAVDRFFLFHSLSFIKRSFINNYSIYLFVSWPFLYLFERFPSLSAFNMDWKLLFECVIAL